MDPGFYSGGQGSEVSRGLQIPKSVIVLLKSAGIQEIHGVKGKGLCSFWLSLSLPQRSMLQDKKARRVGTMFHWWWALLLCPIITTSIRRDCLHSKCLLLLWAYSGYSYRGHVKCRKPSDVSSAGVDVNMSAPMCGFTFSICGFWSRQQIQFKSSGSCL